MDGQGDGIVVVVVPEHDGSVAEENGASNGME